MLGLLFVETFAQLRLAGGRDEALVSFRGSPRRGRLASAVHAAWFAEGLRAAGRAVFGGCARGGRRGSGVRARDDEASRAVRRRVLQRFAKRVPRLGFFPIAPQ